MTRRDGADGDSRWDKIAGPAKGPLSGIRVLEFAGVGPAPFAAMMLADMGADVVEIVRPGTLPAAPTDYYLRGRRRITLDLKRAEDVACAIRLARLADVVVEGFRPGVMERLGLGPGDLAPQAPRLIYARMTGWGQDGPLASTAGHDITYIAIAGALHCMRGISGDPVAPLNLVGDLGGGALYLIAGILAALIDRARTGEGQVIDAAICDGVSHMLTPFYSLRAAGQWKGDAGKNVLDGGAHFYRTYRCSDGRYIAIGAIEPQFYSLMLRRLGLDPEEGPDQADSGGWKTWRDRIAERVATKTRDEWAETFAGLDACVAPVLTLEEAMDHPHARKREIFASASASQAPAPSPRFSRYAHQAPPTPGTQLFSAGDIAASWMHPA